METLKAPESMQFNASNAAELWRRWERQFRVYFDAAELSKKLKATQVAILLHTCGPEGQDIYQTFTWGEEEDKNDINLVLKKFQTHCEPCLNVVFERYVFWERNQQEGESFDQWVMDLKLKAETCRFQETDAMLRDKIVFSISDTAVKERLLREPDITLKKVLNYCRAAETSKAHFNIMNMTQQVHALKISNGKNQNNYKKGNPSKSSYTKPAKPCQYCGNYHAVRRCPAYGKTCHRCQGRNHFESVCKGGGFKKKMYSQSRSSCKPVNQVDRSNEDDHDDYGYAEELFVGSIFIGKLGEHDKWSANLCINKQKFMFKLDTGAHANIIPESMYKQLNTGQSLQKTSTILTAFGDHQIRPKGKVKLNCSTGPLTKYLEFYVTDASDIPILGQNACEVLNLVQRINIDHIKAKQAITKELLLEEYADVFTGLGQIGSEYHIQLRPDVPPVIQPPRKFPYARQSQLKEKLEKMQSLGLIDDVDKPTDWVNSLVVTDKKNGDLRICLDPKPLNKAIKRERHYIATPADVQSKLSGKHLFTVMDMKDGYWQIKLSDESSYLCTFNTPWGRKRFLRMPFGISSAAEVMQKRNEQVFGDIPNVHVIADDVIIAGNNDSDHDATMLKVMNRARECNVKFNKSKIQYKINKVNYMGNIITDEGIKPDLRKVEAIVDMPQPEDKHALQRLLGMVKYLAQYIPNESDITAPLRQLLKDNIEWQWQPEHDNALQRIKQILTEQPVLRFYDVNKPVSIQADASQSGLGCCLLQENKPVAYASRSLTSAEVNYAQIEKEMLAICFACNKFHQYIYGKEVHVQSDHKPLESIFKKPIAKASPRLQRMLLRLQRYTLNVTFTPGKHMYVADTLSRAYIEGEAEQTLIDDMEVMVHSLVTNVPYSPIRLTQIRSATQDDPTLQTLKNTVKVGWPHKMSSVPQSISGYWNIRDEIHIAEDILFVGDRIIIPSALRSDMLSLLHESHLGIEKCKSRARPIMYWPGMNNDIENTVNKCSTCLKHRRSNVKEPMLPHPVPERPWQKVGMDIMTYKNRDYLIVNDYYSKFIEVALLQNKTASNVVTHLKSIFARHGIPETIICDNMPFNSKEFHIFTREWGITLSTSSPTYPQSNGLSERAVQTIKRLMRKADEDGRDPYLALLELRNTPISGLKYSPAQLLMSRMLRTKIPVADHMLDSQVYPAHQQLKERQQTQKKYYDRGTRELSVLKPGDVVRMQVRNQWKPAVVSDVSAHPRSYIVNCDGHEYRRNQRHLMKTNEPIPNVVPVPDPDNSDITESDNPNAVVATPTNATAVANPSVPNNSSPQMRRQSSRVPKKPTRFNDYVC